MTSSIKAFAPGRRLAQGKNRRAAEGRLAMAGSGTGDAPQGGAPPRPGAGRPRPTSPSVRYLRMFNGFFAGASMTSTYKVAFLRALADIGGHGSSRLVGEEWIGHLGGSGRAGGQRHGRRRRTMVVDLEFVAARFAKFYWDMEVGFGLLHISPGSYTTRRPRRLRMAELVRQAAEAYRPPDRGAGEPDPCVPVPRLDELASGRFDGLRKRTVAVLRRDVLDAVLRDMPDLYEVDPGRQHILLDPDLVVFMREYGPTLKRALNHKLAVLLERLNPEARHIATKTDEAPVAERVAAAGHLAKSLPPADRTARCGQGDCTRP